MTKEWKGFAQLTKVDEEKRLVYGRLVQEVVDKSGEILDYETSKPFFEKWVKEADDLSKGQSQGNMRAMHGKVAAGKFTEIIFNDAEKAVDVVGKVIDNNEWEKVLQGVYTGFSVGGSYAKRWEDADGMKRYTAAPNEGSLVDRPCIPTALFFDIQKADGTLAKVDFIKHENTEEVEDMELKKYLGEEAWDAKVALEALVIVQSLLSKEQTETHVEADGQTTDLELVIDRLKSFIASEIQETDENTDPNGMVLAMSDMIGDLEKGDYSGHPFHGNQYAGGKGAGAHNKASRKAHEATKALYGKGTKEGHHAAAQLHRAAQALHEKKGNKYAAQHHQALSNYHQKAGDRFKKVESGDELQKRLEDNLQKIETLEGDLQKVQGENETLKKRITELEAQPEEVRGFLKDVLRNIVIEKVDDNTNLRQEPDVIVKRSDGSIDHEATSLERIKKIHKTGGQVLFKG